MKKYRVQPGERVHLKRIDPSETGNYPQNDDGRAQAQLETEKTLGELDELQEKLYASANQAFLIVLQAMDTGGKDGAIEHVMGGMNPQGCRVASFKVPSAEEMSHDFLWRVHKQTPPKGYIGIFNRSHYEDVLVTRVHGMIDKKTQKRRFEEINDFEKLLTRNGTVIRKFFLHISKDEQKRRLEARRDDPKKHWKFSMNDLKERRLWPQYQRAFEETLGATSMPHAPWYIIPANRKWYRNYLVGKILVETLKEMKLKYPKAPAEIDFSKIKIK